MHVCDFIFLCIASCCVSEAPALLMISCDYIPVIADLILPCLHQRINPVWPLARPEHSSPSLSTHTSTASGGLHRSLPQTSYTLPPTHSHTPTVLIVLSFISREKPAVEGTLCSIKHARFGSLLAERDNAKLTH